VLTLLGEMNISVGPYHNGFSHSAVISKSFLLLELNLG